MRRVDVEKAAAVGAQLLDRDLRSSRSHRHRDFGYQLAIGSLDRLHQGGGIVRFEVLNDALRNKHERKDQRQRQQDVERGAHQVEPEVADRRRGPAGQSADQGHQHRHAGGRRNKILHAQAEHLRQIAHRRFAAVALPVRVRGKADGGVERRIGTIGGKALRIERQDLLHSQQQINGQRIRRTLNSSTATAYFFHDISCCGSMPRESIDQSLEPAERTIESAGPPLIDPGHVNCPAAW